VAEDEVAELVGQGPVTSGQSLLDEEDVAVGVLPPLTADSSRKVCHLELDGSTAVLCYGFH
jgi:hypothetical protein